MQPRLLPCLENIYKKLLHKKDEGVIEAFSVIWRSVAQFDKYLETDTQIVFAINGDTLNKHIIRFLNSNICLICYWISESLLFA